MPLRIIFMGTAELAGASLEILARSPAFHLLAVVTQPDRPKGRDLKLQPSPVKIIAARLHLPVLQPARARDPAFCEHLRAFAPDLIVVAAYGQLLPPGVLEIPTFGCLNLHTSLLPKYRGAAPIQWALLNGDPETGVTIMKMDAGLDTGDILSRERTSIQPDDTAETLHDRLARLGSELLARTIPEYVAGNIVPQKQPETGSSHARKISKEDGRIDWTRPAFQIRNQIRAFTPWPGAFTFESHRMLLKIWQGQIEKQSEDEPGMILSAGPEGIVVRCGEDSLRVTLLQRKGGRKLGARDFLSGHRLIPGQKLG